MSWPLVKLGEVAPSKALKNPVVLSDDNVWQLNLDMVESNSGRVINKLKAPLREAGSSTHWFDERHVLYSKLRPYLNKVVLPDEQGLATTELVPMLPDPEKLDRRYLVHYLRSKQFVSWISDQVAGAKMPRVSMKIFWDHEIPLPPLAEQKRIAAILDKADAIRQKRKQAIELADEFLRSVFLDMFGDPVTNPKGWEVKPLKCVADIVTGNTPSRNDAENYGAFIEWIKSDNINTPSHFLTQAEEYLSEVGMFKGRTVDEGSILMTCIAGSLSCIGNIAIANRKVAFNQQINALVPNKSVYLEYLYALMLCSKEQIQNSSTNSMKGMVSKGTLSALSFPVASIEEQNKFVKVFNKYLELIDKKSVFSSESANSFNSLSQKAFSGQL